MRLRILSRLTGLTSRALVNIGVLSVVLAGVLVSSGVSAASARASTSSNLITNGCLQVPSLTSGYDTFEGESTQIPGWTVGGDSVDVMTADKWEPGPGCRQSVDLAGNAQGSVSRTVSTTPGVSYLLRWEMAGDLDGGPVVKAIHVFWEGRLVAAPTFDTAGHSDSSMGWVDMHVTVDATRTRSVVTFADVSAGNTAYGATLDNVSLAVQSTTVNGFRVTDSNDAYSVAERQMLAKVPESAVVSASGVPICALQAFAAEQAKNGTGLLIIWDIAPSSQFISETSATQQAKAQLVEQYLTGLLTRSRNLYLAVLRADRLPLQGSADLASWWGVRVESRSTTGLLMSFQIAKSGTTSAITWSNVVGVSSTNAAAAPSALASLLYYTKKIAVLPGSTTT
jgi:hypothetical protein